VLEYLAERRQLHAGFDPWCNVEGDRNAIKGNVEGAGFRNDERLTAVQWVVCTEVVKSGDLVGADARPSADVGQRLPMVDSQDRRATMAGRRTGRSPPAD